MKYKLNCPRCGAPKRRARLEIVSGTFECTRLYLEEDGFTLDDARQFETASEYVWCNACNDTFPLDECVDHT